MRALVLSLLAASALALPALAGTKADDNARYSVEAVEGGYLRTDRETGISSFCRPTSGAWSCTLVPDDLEAFEDEISRLNRRIETLEDTRNEMRKRIELLEGEDRHDGDGDTSQQKSQQDGIDRAMGALERMTRGFLAFVAEIGGYFTK
ncbi:MAG: hypothetical protein H6883_02920 [Rhodobiaceae bacterium]|nr:hypothetical protein [Rhodobiaceae bacterium]MCC0055070.1 hypothetical protein [Rhodobiaceae bacterium]